MLDERDFERLTKASQALLLDFLRTELEIATTFIDMAESYPPHRARLLQKARRALDTIRAFAPRINDLAQIGEIDAHAFKLKQRLETFDSE